MPKPGFLLVLTFSLAGLVGCAEHEPGAPPAAPESPRPQALSGTLTENVRRLEAGDYREDCDDKFHSSRREIAAALDARRAEIDRFVGEKPDLTNIEMRRVRLGSTTVRERVAPRSPRPGWRSFVVGWGDAVANFERLRRQPVNDGWVQLNRDVRSLLGSDLERAVRGTNPYLDKDSGPALELLASVLERCAGDSDSVSLPEALRPFIAAQPIYRGYLAYVDRQPSRAERRRYLERFRRYVNGDRKLYRFDTNPRMDRVGPGKYELFADPGPFAGVAGQLAAYVESAWSGPGTQVRIRWKRPDDYPDLFRVLLGKTPGERSYVDAAQRQVMLFPDVRGNSIAHEFGHVMGFRDRYYEVWQPESCQYRVEYSEEDIMSDSDQGVVLPAHWEELANHYH